MTKYILLFAACLLAAPLNAAEQPIDADLVWVEYDGIRYEIFFSTMHKGVWTKPYQVTDDHYNNLHPVIDRDSKGRRWLLWTGMDSHEYTIRYSSRRGEGEWSNPALIVEDLTAAMAPTLMVDSEDIVWAAWTGNNGDNDDIFFSRYRSGKWTRAARVHPVNETPDILPLLRREADGTILLRWQGIVDGGYSKLESAWKQEKWGKPAVLTEESKQAEAESDPVEIELPEFVSDPARAYMHIYE